MRKAPFSGITILEPNDNPMLDGAAFFEKDPAIVDHFLEVGAVTHRHDAHDPLPNPTLPASASVEETGGSIGPDISIAIGYTLTDPDGGETVLSPIATVTTPPPYDPPETAPTAAVEYTGGELLADTYYYGVTLLDGAGGETPLGNYTAATRDPGYASGQIRLTDLTADFASTGAVAWRLYRSRGGEEFNFLATGSGDEFLDDGTIPLNCDLTPPSIDANSTNGTNTLVVQMPSSAAILAASPDAVSFTLYGTVSGSWTSPSVLSGPNPVVASGGMEFTFPTLAFGDGSPPDVSTSVPGASQIDPDTDLIDWHWKRPVDTVGDLPTVGTGEGDVRIVKASGVPYIATADGGPWQVWSADINIASVAASGSVSVAPTSDILFVGSGGVTAEVVDDGGGAARVILETADLATYGKGFAEHGSDASFPRPVGFASVEWYGDVAPLNALPVDSWTDTS